MPDEIRELFFGSPVWGIVVTLADYLIGIWVNRKTKSTVLQPILIAAALIISFLMLTGTEFEEYNQQNQILNYILSLTAVVLAVPLYRNLDLLKKYALPVLAGVACGTAATIAVVIVMGRLMGTEHSILVSMIPKSATNPIAVPVSEIIGGNPTLTLAMVVIVGIGGAVAGPELLKGMGVKNPVAKGIAMGTISHAVGTSRAFREGEIQGAMSSLAMALAGALTAFLAPLAASLLQ